MNDSEIKFQCCVLAAQSMSDTRIKSGSEKVDCIIDLAKRMGEWIAEPSQKDAKPRMTVVAGPHTRN